MNDQRWRVAQWGTGHTGRRSLQTVIEHPRYDLVALHVHSPEKAGRDAGEIAGTAPTGVIATRSIDEVIAARPDCLLYMPLIDHASTDELCALLTAGINVISTTTEFHHPPTMDAGRRERIEAACRHGNATLYETGPSPGFIEENLPLTAMLLMRRLDSLRIDQCADLSGRASPAFLGKFFGVNRDTDMSDVAARSITTDGAALRQLGDTIGLPLDAVTTAAQPALARTTTKIGVTTIEAGTVGAWQMDVIGWRGGKQLMIFSRTMYVVRDLDPAWPLHDTGWHVEIRGDAPLDIDIRFARENYDPISPGYNAHIAVNAVPAVCEAAPGIRVTADLRLFPLFG